MTNIALSNTCSNNNSMAMEFQACFSITILPFITKKNFFGQLCEIFLILPVIFLNQTLKKPVTFINYLCAICLITTVSHSLFRPLTSLCPRVLYLCS